MGDLKLLHGDFLVALLIGIIVVADLYLLLERVLGFQSPQARKAVGIFAGAAGVLTTLFLRENPQLLHEVSTKLVLALVALLLATLALLRRRIS